MLLLGNNMFSHSKNTHNLGKPKTEKNWTTVIKLINHDKTHIDCNEHTEWVNRNNCTVHSNKLMWFSTALDCWDE